LQDIPSLAFWYAKIEENEYPGLQHDILDGWSMKSNRRMSRFGRSRDFRCSTAPVRDERWISGTVVAKSSCSYVESG